MSDPAELFGRLVRFVGDILGQSSLRFDFATTIAVLGVLLILLQLVARPVTRWTTTDAGGLGSVGRAMALAAEAGTDVVVSLGTAGLTRSTDALARLQTLAAVQLLGHIGRAAARSGVPLRVLTNDPLAATVATATIESAHEATSTRERAERSRAVFVGEGRGVPAGLAATARAHPAAAFAYGSLREEAQLHLDGLASGAGALSAGTAEPSQPPAVRLATSAGMIGPELYQAAANLRSDVLERTTVLAANRLIALTVLALAIGAVLSLLGVIDPAEIVGAARP